MPYQQEINDIPSIMARLSSGKQFADDIVDAFDEMLEQALHFRQSLVLGIALHPYIVGQPHRLRHLRRALQHIHERAKTLNQDKYKKIWLTTPGEIARTGMLMKTVV
mmetsp:Transcript_4317/g.15514  ORF Transcript_4317/g.15514 Transcript_4317/m.15514 type:complete len:107 (+) Transcript_4317:669-989(+)